jgi:nucleoside-diphosphate-sugar epimerase
MKILVTGGAGYLGSVLVTDLLYSGYDVTVLDLFKGDSSRSLVELCGSKEVRFTPIKGDVRNLTDLSVAMARCDILIPLAAIVGAPACEDDWGATSTNLSAIEQMIGLRSQSQAILFPCTNSGYGISRHHEICDEESPLAPISKYGRLKVAAERIVLNDGNSVTFRFATLFGCSPRMRLDLLVNDFVYRAVKDRSIIVFEGHAKRNYLHVRDASRAFLHAIENFEAMEGRPYNVGLSDANLSKLELCERIKRHVPELFYSESPIGEDPDKRDYVVSNKRIEATGFKPKYSLDDGIRELIKAYLMLDAARYRNA